MTVETGRGIPRRWSTRPAKRAVRFHYLCKRLGGAIGIALIDTVMYSRAPVHARVIFDQLLNGNVETAKAVGIPLKLFLERVGKPMDSATQDTVKSMVEQLALVQSINDAWLVIAILTLAALLCVPLVRFQQKPI